MTRTLSVLTLFIAAVITKQVFVVATDLLLTKFLNEQNNTIEIIHGTGKNKFLVLPDHSGRYRIPDLGMIDSLNRVAKYNVMEHQLPDSEVIAVPVLGIVIDNRLPELAPKKGHCADLFPVAAHPSFERLDHSKPIEVLYPSGCSSGSWTNGSDHVINEYFPRPYFSILSKSG